MYTFSFIYTKRQYVHGMNTLLQMLQNFAKYIVSNKLEKTLNWTNLIEFSFLSQLFIANQEVK